MSAPVSLCLEDKGDNPVSDGSHVFYLLRVKYLSRYSIAEWSGDLQAIRLLDSIKLQTEQLIAMYKELDAHQHSGKQIDDEIVDSDASDDGIPF